MKMEGIELYPHNQKAYDNLCAMLRDNNRACVVQPTGTGKFVIIAKMAQDNPGKTFFFSVPMITCTSTRWRTFPISLPDSLRRICNL